MKILFILLYILATGITGFAQVLLKMSTMNKPDFFIINRYLVVGYLLFFITTVISVYCLKKISLLTATALLPLSYLFTFFFTKIILNESISKRKILSVFIIITGIVIYSWGNFE